MVQLIPKKEKKPLVGEWFFLIVAVGLFAVAGTVFVVFEQMQSRAAEARDLLDATLTEKIQPREREMEREIKKYQEQLAALKIVLADRPRFLAFLEALEKTTHPAIFFSSMAGSMHGGEIELQGTASDFFTLEQQRFLWEAIEEFEEVELSGIGLSGNGGAAFQAQFLF